MAEIIIPQKTQKMETFEWLCVMILVLFRWFKFTLKPPYSMAIENFISTIWVTFHWNSFVKFGLKTAYDMS